MAPAGGQSAALERPGSIVYKARGPSQPDSPAFQSHPDA
jgi:hypothetical protein